MKGKQGVVISANTATSLIDLMRILSYTKQQYCCLARVDSSMVTSLKMGGSTRTNTNTFHDDYQPI